MASAPARSVIERYQPALGEFEQNALRGFLASYRGFTREADLRQITTWCWQHDRRLFDVRWVDIECFCRDLADRGRARATVARRLCTVAGFYRYAEEEGAIEHSPAVHPIGPDSTTSPMSLISTATSSARSWSPPGCRRHAITPSCHCWR